MYDAVTSIIKKSENKLAHRTLKIEYANFGHYFIVEPEPFPVSGILGVE